MEWGIINRKNFKGKTTYDLPIKRWDPLSTISIKSDEFGLHKNEERFYGHYAYLSPIREKRPSGFENEQEQNQFSECLEKDFTTFKDVFTGIVEGGPVYNKSGKMIGDGYTIIIAEDDKKRDNPFYEIPHRIDHLSKYTKAITLINRYPAMARIIDPEIEKEVSKKLPTHIRLAKGINLITISKDFYPSSCLNHIPEDVIIGIFVSMKEAILNCILEAIEKNYYDIPVNPFFNIGEKAGGSQPRIHSQVYIDLNGDGHGSRLEGYLRAFREMGDNCHLCETSHGDTDRIIVKSKYWTFYTSGSPVRNYHIRFHPNEHIRRFDNLKINQMKDLAKILKSIFAALDELKVEKNRNILFNCCPYGYDANFHLFGDIIPHEVIGGAEMADDMRVARKLPHIAAAEIRQNLDK
jgi:UDPglucose--hexose-1-phosphate uridylyltransferase